MTVPVSALQAVAPSAIIELFELQLSQKIHGATTTYRFHPGVNANGTNSDVIWAGNTYQAFPIEAEGFEYSGNGQLPRPKIRVSNILGTITALILVTPLEGAKVTRIRTMARYLDAINFPDGVNPYGSPDSTAEFPREVYYIDRKSIETRNVVEYELAAAFDLVGVRAPKRQCISNICQWEYRSAECGYTEAAYYDENDAATTQANDVCGKRLSSCKIRFGSIVRTGTATKGSTTLTVNSTAGLIAGLPISSFCVASGTTIASITNATTLVMSAAAIASSTQAQAATPSTTDAAMTVANGATLSTGMAVTGAYIPGGTTITAISGNTVTLNQRPYSFTKSATYNLVLPAGAGWFMNTTGISVGMRVFGAYGINTTVSGIYSNAQGAYITFANGTTSAGFGVQTTLYFMPATVSSASYTFTGSTSFVFRSSVGELPFGSFPGVGAYFT